MDMTFELNEKDLKRMVFEELKRQLGDFGDQVSENDLKFEVITKENYRASKWEEGRFRVSARVIR